ncbi:hypothetical protein SPRG_01993 [Saprolegnia parasitica CBS 223.65]|uniref:Uncharacterized protein n=1 Tax=Saprolegnia parasitica (strain CBS 223.65) TaxID=695850 RepID=A0A067D3A4_SAPPC|nr:hypothetical protein SPRG_01993 [Saprolegnia parasitica CBS 223.65]KDO33181.1 hypothetical protein SPRG_01993 [Saprolegnia parasitica CBS 223.65]|eukprot:XP_012195942.1 hypothetical protein SPRG_01993 [Saprolegnia parasitica CBS 223.65]
MKALLLLLLSLSVASAVDSSICAAPKCLLGNQPGNFAVGAVALDSSPCYQNNGNELPGCYAYDLAGKCPPFRGVIDCGKVATPAPTTTPPTTTAASTTTLDSVTPPPSTKDGGGAGSSTDSGGSSSSNKIWPYVVGGGVALVAIAVLVIVMVKKSSRTNEEDDLDPVEYAKPIPTSSSGNFKDGNINGGMPNPRPGYNNSFLQADVEKSYPARANPSFNQGPTARQNPSFLNQPRAQQGYGNAFPQAQVVPPIYSQQQPTSNNNSLGPHAAPPRRESRDMAPPGADHAPPKEQFYVPQVELHFGEHEEPSGRRESYEF